MDFLRINATKLKITLSRDECIRYDIKETDGDFDTARVREIISDILEEAGQAKDFRLGKEKLLVQLYPTAGGGAELFVTKLSGIGERERRAIHRADNLSTYSRESAFFLFPELESLCRAARAMRTKGKNGEVYKRALGGYILAVDEDKLGGFSDCDILLEFGERTPIQNRTVIAEWDKLIAKGDVFSIFSRF